MDIGLGTNIRGIVFDKDGTLFDFQQSWATWMAEIITGLSDDDETVAARAACKLGFDAEANLFEIDSPFVAGTPESTLELLNESFPRKSVAEILRVVEESTMRCEQVEVVPLKPLIRRLADAGFRLGIATNDAESTARLHLERAGVLEDFEFVVGSDSGHVPKPDSAMLDAFAEHVGLPARQCVMVGDSSWDLAAGRAAGMSTAGVLTGTATSDMLAPLADIVLPHVGCLPEWLGLAAEAVSA